MTQQVPEPTRASVVVIDVNVLVAAAIRGTGSTLDLLRAVESGTIRLVVSPLLLAELLGVLRRARFRKWLTLDEAEEFVESIELMAELIDDPASEGFAPATRDPKDDYLVFLAEHAGADFLVSRDRDLLECDRPGLAVHTPERLLERLR